MFQLNRPAIAAIVVLMLSSGCATLRVTDPPRTATEQFMLNIATTRAIEQLSSEALRDRPLYIDSTYLTAATQPSQEHSFLIGELRAKLLLAGVRLVPRREEAQVILEVRSEAVGIDRIESLVGIPSIYISGNAPGDSSVPIATPELAIVKNTRQRGYASVAFVAYWSDSGELIAASGPFVGRTVREDFWFFGVGPRTTGDIPPARQ